MIIAKAIAIILIVTIITLTIIIITFIIMKHYEERQMFFSFHERPISQVANRQIILYEIHM